ncbi:uncharacterized protein MYCFIDRAFT_84397 [Pseudocercospora fijiensis CIRAD86]|uniref:Uncharacterized protein n=1 Tax=Pseudocercospora fijiensis (strain CIRAD86) TaxID=383855 RepID=M3AJ71_PSEFD|nr:uncharacterized protein MYCFIDRAFT_84397 [Pseudocercospora fijiensis CIRAD86]EME77532.1 hypothetical protein MYCFIDRAFT_84397 [Pseudocercospora fijiensis CIRAD86]
MKSFIFASVALLASNVAAMAVIPRAPLDKRMAEFYYNQQCYPNCEDEKENKRAIEEMMERDERAVAEIVKREAEFYYNQQCYPNCEDEKENKRALAEIEKRAAEFYYNQQCYPNCEDEKQE